MASSPESSLAVSTAAGSGLSGATSQKGGGNYGGANYGPGAFIAAAPASGGMNFSLPVLIVASVAIVAAIYFWRRK